MADKKTWQKTVICAGEGCIETFERRSPRHKYCDECAEKRKAGYYKEWYNKRGGRQRKQIYYETVLKEKVEEERRENPEEIRARDRSYYQRVKDTPRYKRRIAQYRHLTRKRRKQEAEEGGRPFRDRKAPLVEAYLRGEFDVYPQEEQEDE